MADKKDLKTKVAKFKEAAGVASVLETKPVNLASVFKQRGIELRMATEGMEDSKKGKVVEMAIEEKMSRAA
jgi:hypothetical protein